jgi:hypothetical protein
MTDADTFTLFGYVLPTCRHGRTGGCPFCAGVARESDFDTTPYVKPPRDEFIAIPFIHHSQESEDAAHSIKAKAPSLRERVYELLQTGSFTDEQIAQKLDLNPSTSRPRRVELERMGLIESHGTALTASGRSASLWRAVPTKSDR